MHDSIVFNLTSVDHNYERELTENSAENQAEGREEDLHQIAALPGGALLWRREVHSTIATR